MRTLLLCIVIAGCGGSSESSGGAPVTQAQIDDSCAQSCAAQKKCNSKVDETTCTNDCKNRAASYAGKVRSDYVTLLNQCIQGASCDQIGKCDDTAKSSLAASPTVQSFCDALIAKHAECKWPDGDTARCLDTYKVFTDAAIENARACLSKACGDYGACVLSTLGVKL